MPKPRDEHRKLQLLAGDWSGSEILYPSPWEPQWRTASGHFHSRMAVDGFFLVTDYEEECDGRVTFRGHGVYGWDGKVERYTMHWFDSMGEVPSQVIYGTWEGDTLAFQRQAPMGHSRYIYVVGDGRYAFRIEGSRDGQSWTKFMEGQYKRK